MQEELENKSVVLTIKAAKLTAKGLAVAMRFAYQQFQKARDKPGKKSMKQLRKGGDLSKVEITDDNIKAFDPIARKYGIRYSLEKDNTGETPKWRVYFRAKSSESMHDAFKEFSDTIFNAKEKDKDKPSVRETIRDFREKLAHAVRDITKNKHRGGPEL